MVAKKVKRKPGHYVIKLAEGRKKAELTFSCKTGEVERKVRVVEGVPVVFLNPSKVEIFGELPEGRRLQSHNLRDKDGKLIKVNVKVPSCYVSMKLTKMDGTTVTIKARSCCKPPDVFDKIQGRKYALKHLFAKCGTLLTSLDREEIVRGCCPQFFKKRSEV